MLHYAWPWLVSHMTKLVCCLFPAMPSYARLRHEVVPLWSIDISRIKLPLNFYLPNPTIVVFSRSRDVAKIFLLCHFDFGLFKRFTGSIYTGNVLDFDAIDALSLNRGSSSLTRLSMTSIVFATYFTVASSIPCDGEVYVCLILYHLFLYRSGFVIGRNTYTRHGEYIWILHIM